MRMEHYVTAYDSESEELLAFVFSVPGAFVTVHIPRPD